MREIKFRAWDKKYNQMVSWDDISKNNIIGALINNNNRSISHGVLMQFTGLLDKNGVEIYEGDILYFEPYETHGNDRVVEYKDGAYHGRLIRSGYSKLLSECVYETKVIGNIYENPGLLEG
jgi:uncharacterized phage protein (TIGR01671 family)